jgi:hypothetical protein
MCIEIICTLRQLTLGCTINDVMARDRYRAWGRVEIHTVLAECVTI